MRTLATKQPSKDSSQKQNGYSARRSHHFSPLTTGKPLLQRKCACGGGCPRCQEELGIQTKLKISEPGDKYEQEADRMAEWIMSCKPEQSAPLARISAAPVADIHRVAEEVSPTEDDAQEIAVEPDESPELQRMADSDSSLHPPDRDSLQSWQTTLNGSHDRGQPLSSTVHHFMTNRFQADFRDVKIHADSEAHQLSQAIAARAFTSGTDIYFADGEYQPETQAGQRLLAHELTHVLQQQGVSPHPDIQRLPDLNQTSPSNIARTNVAPWAPRPNPRGNDYQISTDAGTSIKVWVAYGGYATEQQYWCHGHSLGSFARSGYSVYSGTNNMGRVIADEWRSISSASASAGDIAVFMPDFQHSARFVSPVVSSGVLDESASQLSTKNGMAPLRTDSLSNILSVYPGTYSVYRRR